MTSLAFMVNQWNWPLPMRMQCNLLAHVQVAARRHLTQVRLADIARWAQNDKPAWKLPPEFPREEEEEEEAQQFVT